MSDCSPLFQRALREKDIGKKDIGIPQSAISPNRHIRVQEWGFGDDDEDQDHACVGGTRMMEAEHVRACRVVMMVHEY